MRKVVVSAWLSLDGVSEADTMNQWFDPYHSDDRAAVIQDMALEADALLMGRHTYNMLMPYWSNMHNNEFDIADQLNHVPKYVVSTTLREATWNNAHLIRDHVMDEVARLKQQPGKSILIYGSGTLVASLLDAGLIDEICLLVHPAIAGSGKRFFEDGKGLSRLQLLESKPLDLGVLLLRYQPVA